MTSHELRVSDLMTRDVFTLSPLQSLPLAEAVMGLQRIRHIPVIDDDRTLVGLVTHRDLLAAKISALAPLTADERSTLELSIPVEKIMRGDVWTIAPDALAVSAARIMQDHQFGCLPVVVADRKLVGIITEGDLLALVTRDLEMVKPSTLTADHAMSRSPITIDLHTTIHEARNLMRRYSVHHLPIVENGRAIALVSDRDLRVAEIVYQEVNHTSAAHAARLVGNDVVHRVRRSESLELVFRRMFDLRVDFAVVEDDDHQLVGVLAALDACRMFANATGLPPALADSASIPTARAPESPETPETPESPESPENT